MVTLPFPLRLFVRWITENRSSFVIPIAIDRTSRDAVHFHFQGVAKSLSGVLCRDGQLMVMASLEGECWDILIDFDLAERVAADRRYTCELCHPSSRKDYALRRDLWIEHSFVPLLQWINDVLAKNRFIEFHQLSQGGSTWVKLSVNETIRGGASTDDSGVFGTAASDPHLACRIQYIE